MDHSKVRLIQTTPIYAPQDGIHKMLLYGSSPSPLLDSTIWSVYENTTSSLGMTT